MAKVISFLNQKGGVCKTTTVMASGHSLAKNKLKTLMIDLDGQASLSKYLGVSEDRNNIYHLLKGNVEFKPIEITKGLDLIPSSIDLIAFETEIVAEAGREYILKEALATFKDAYDYVLIDCSPSLGLTTLNALTASDSYLIPVLPEPSSVQGFATLMDVVAKIKSRLNDKLELEGVLLTKVEKNIRIHQSIEQSFREYLPSKIFKSTIRKNIALVESTSFHQSIFDYAPKSNAAIDYTHFSKEFIQNQSIQ